MNIKEGQDLVYEHLKEVGYTKSETKPEHAFLHLAEEVGEVSRTMLHKGTKRGDFSNTTDVGNMEDEIADILWQTMKLASYLDIDLEKAFKEKLEKNRNKNK
ncbi:MAG: MazG nucleotide pyrophosphohydrolase domain-containing protein [Nanobdellota archaeon]